MNEELAPHPLLILRLRGSQAEMGKEMGRALRSVGGYEQAMGFYPTMASRMLSASVPHRVRRPFEAVARRALLAQARFMHTHRARLFPEYAARTQALLDASGSTTEHPSSFLVMDVLQNAVGMLARAGALPRHIGRFAAVPACSSLAVWGDASSDGALRHARNFDFPGAGIWDAAPMITFCTPDEGLRYGFVSTRGADVPGVTCFNEAGITLTAHTRFHRDVRYDGAAVVDIGHEIVRHARTLEGAIRIAQRVGSASSWGFLVSSASEHDAAIIETTGSEVRVVRRDRHAGHLACTNRYRAHALRADEVTPSRVYVADSESRFERLEQAVREAKGGLSPEALEALLGDFGSPFCEDGHADVTRLAGDCIVSPMTVQSVVCEPESACIRVSIGLAPTCFGPYVTVPWTWDGTVCEVLASGDSALRATGHRGEELDAHARGLIRRYADISSRNVAGATPAETRERLETLVTDAPNEPSFRTLAGYAAIHAGDFARARTHLEAALVLEHGAFRRARIALFLTRVLVVLGDHARAEEVRAALLAMTQQETLAERHAAAKEQQKPLRASALRLVVLDLFLIDASLPTAA